MFLFGARSGLWPRNQNKITPIRKATLPPASGRRIDHLPRSGEAPLNESEVALIDVPVEVV